MASAKKGIREFLLGKIRRSEIGGELSLTERGSPHPELGDHEGDVLTSAGTCATRWFASGVLWEAGAVQYRDLARIEANPLTLTLESGAVLRPELSGVERDLCYATLRWIGRALLRRPLDRPETHP